MILMSGYMELKAAGHIFPTSSGYVNVSPILCPAGHFPSWRISVISIDTLGIVQVSSLFQIASKDIYGLSRRAKYYAFAVSRLSSVIYISILAKKSLTLSWSLSESKTFLSPEPECNLSNANPLRLRISIMH